MIFVIGFAGVAVSASLAGPTLGFGFLECGPRCKALESLAVSAYLGVGSLAVTLASIVVFSISLRNPKFHRYFLVLAALQGIAAVVAYFGAKTIGSPCNFCFLLQSLWLLTALFAPKGLAPLVLGSTATLLLLPRMIEVWDFHVAPMAMPGKFIARTYEPRIVGTPGAVVIFTDPACQACRLAHRKTEPKNVGVPVIQRWLLVTAPRDRSLTAAALIEQACLVNPLNGAKLRELIFRRDEWMDGGDLAALGIEAGFNRAELEEWTKRPSAVVLGLIASDGAVASTMMLRELPQACVVNTVMADGGPPLISKLSLAKRDFLAREARIDFSGLAPFFEPDQGENP